MYRFLLIVTDVECDTGEHTMLFCTQRPVHNVHVYVRTQRPHCV